MGKFKKIQTYYGANTSILSTYFMELSNKYKVWNQFITHVFSTSSIPSTSRRGIQIPPKPKTYLRWTSNYEADQLLEQIFSGNVLIAGKQLDGIENTSYIYSKVAQFHENCSADVFWTLEHNERNISRSRHRYVF